MLCNLFYFDPWYSRFIGNENFWWGWNEIILVFDKFISKLWSVIQPTSLSNIGISFSFGPGLALSENRNIVCEQKAFRKVIYVDKNTRHPISCFEELKHLLFLDLYGNFSYFIYLIFIVVTKF